MESIRAGDDEALRPGAAQNELVGVDVRKVEVFGGDVFRCTWIGLDAVVAAAENIGNLSLVVVRVVW